MLGTRVQEIAGSLGLDNRKISAFLGIHESTPSKWREREEGGADPQFSSLRLVHTALQKSYDYLTGATDEPSWAPAVVKVQNEMRRWAQSEDTQHLADSNRRLIAAWERFRELAPGFELRTWLLYLRWTSEDWAACLSGRKPSGVQLEAAADITGIPAQWFWSGAASGLAPMSEYERQMLERYMTDEDCGPEDLIRAHKQNKHPRA